MVSQLTKITSLGADSNRLTHDWQSSILSAGHRYVQ